MRLKTTGAVIALAAAFGIILFSGCAILGGDRNGSPKCIADSLGKAFLKDCEREMCIAVSSGKDVAYWIDGERSTPGSNWHLKHIECRSNGCLYRCKETEALWLLSISDMIVEMEKQVPGTTLPQKYRFEARK